MVWQALRFWLMRIGYIPISVFMVVPNYLRNFMPEMRCYYKPKYGPSSQFVTLNVFLTNQYF